MRYTQNIPYPYKKKNAVDFVRDSIKKWNQGKDYCFGLVLNKEVVGICSLVEVDKKNRSAELGYWLGRKFWGRGIMTQAAAKVIEFGFKELNLHRIQVCHMEENKASQKVILKQGFKQEGADRECRFRFGRWHKILRYSLLEKEYKEKLKKK